jgi:hypothetical protein
MATEIDGQRAAKICDKISDEKVRFFWLKLGEAIALSGDFPASEQH